MMTNENSNCKMRNQTRRIKAVLKLKTLTQTLPTLMIIRTHTPMGPGHFSVTAKVCC